MKKLTTAFAGALAVAAFAAPSAQAAQTIDPCAKVGDVLAPHLTTVKIYVDPTTGAVLRTACGAFRGERGNACRAVGTALNQYFEDVHFAVSPEVAAVLNAACAATP